MESIVILGSLVFAVDNRVSRLLRPFAAWCLELGSNAAVSPQEAIVVLGSLVCAPDLKVTHMV